MNPNKCKAHLAAAALPALIVALLTAGIPQPAHAQGGLLKKLQGVSRSISDKAEKADSAVTKVGQTADAVECLTDDEECAKQHGTEQSEGVVADPSGAPFPSPVGVVSAPGQCQSGPRAPPDSSEA
jgi:hypothetical protein